MPYVVAELYGQSLQGAESRKEDLRRAYCPFMEQLCDGGGNRDMMRIPASDEVLGTLFDDSVGKTTGGSLPCGVCSVKPAEKPRMWAVCPRRLFSFGTQGVSARHTAIARRILSLAGFQPGDQVSVWSEITLKETNEQQKAFNYRLDYVLRGRGRDAPPIVLEVMTCSTSGGNRNLKTDMKSAFRSAVYSAFGLKPGPALSPSVNIRQVWARMASQMIAKSEAALRWGGRTIWVVQDLLADYIRTHTALPMDTLRSTDWNADEVNLVVSDLHSSLELYSGPIRSRGSDRHCWLEILGAPHVPPLESIERKLREKEPVTFRVP